MSKGQDIKKDSKKEPQKTMKEKKAAKREKKNEKNNFIVDPRICIRKYNIEITRL